MQNDQDFKIAESDLSKDDSGLQPKPKTKLQEFREKNPAYKGVSDYALTARLYAAHYNGAPSIDNPDEDMSFDEFSKHFGFEKIGLLSGFGHRVKATLADFASTAKSFKRVESPSAFQGKLPRSAMWDPEKPQPQDPDYQKKYKAWLDKWMNKKDVALEALGRMPGSQQTAAKKRAEYLQNQHGFSENEALRSAITEERAKAKELALDTLEHVQKQFELPPELRERPQSFIEQVFGGLATSAVAMPAFLVNPVIGYATVYSQIHGSKVQELEWAGVEDPEVVLKSAITSAALQTPLEAAGNLFMLSRILKANGTWTKAIVNIAESMGGEGFTEFVQQYPDEFATMMAMNPDLSASQLLDEFTKRENLWKTTKSAVEAAAVGAVAGGSMTSVGVTPQVLIESLITDEQKAINARKAGSPELTEKEQRARKISKAVAIQNIIKTPEEREATPYTIPEEEIQRYIENPESSTIKDEDLDLVIGDMTDDQVLDEIMRRQGFSEDQGDDFVPAQIGKQAEQKPVDIESPNFKQWFGDSKVVDESGKPLVVYHGTYENFDIFNRSYLGDTTFGNANDNKTRLSSALGFWFNSGEIKESLNAPYDIYLSTYLQINNPIEFDSLDDLKYELQEIAPDEFIDDYGILNTIADEWVTDRQQEGYDGVIIKNDEEFGGTSFVAFEPTQIKSAISNTGEFSRTDPNITAQIGPGDISQIFYSAVEKGITEFKQDSAPASDWLNIISKIGKQEERDWIGLKDWLKEQKGKVSKQEILDFVRANNVEVQEIVKGFEKQDIAIQLLDETDGVEEEGYYLVTPEHGEDKLVGPFDDYSDAEYAWNNSKAIDQTKFSEYQLPGGKNYKEIFLTSPEVEGYSWQDGHPPYSDVKNPIVRLRVNERADSNGGRVFFIEEVQGPLKEQVEQMPKWMQEGKNQYLMAMKWAVRYAAENGFDAIAWTPGEVQAERYDLSRIVKRIEVNPRETGWRYVHLSLIDNSDITLNVDRNGKILESSGGRTDYTNKNLDEVVGKEHTEKIMSSKEDMKIEGEDLKVGGEKLKNLYNKMLPAVANKFFKKYGAKVGTTNIDVIQEADIMNGIEEERGNLEVWSMPITDKLKETAIYEGFPQFDIGKKQTTEPLPVFDSSKINHKGLRDAAQSGMISEQEAAVFDGIMQFLPEHYREIFEPRFSDQQFAPTPEQLKAHGMTAEQAQGQVVQGALLTERIQDAKDEARHLAVMFSGADVTTFFHEFGEFSYKRLLTPEEKKYIASVASRKAKGTASNEFFSDALRSYMMREVGKTDSIFPPKLQGIIQKVADTIKAIWERLRNFHSTPALDAIFKDILTGQRDIQPLGEFNAAAQTGIRTLRGRIKQLGGINFLNFKGELKDMDVAVKYISSKSGVGIDQAEKTLKAEGWLQEDETLLDILRDDPDVLRRGHIQDIGMTSKKRKSELTDMERRYLSETEYEQEDLPYGNYAQMEAADLPEGEVRIIVTGKGVRGWGKYLVAENDVFSIRLESTGADLISEQDRTIDLKPGDLVEVWVEGKLEEDIQELIDSDKAKWVNRGKIVDRVKELTGQRRATDEAKQLKKDLQYQARFAKGIYKEGVREGVEKGSEKERVKQARLLREALRKTIIETRKAFRAGDKVGFERGKATIRAIMERAKNRRTLRQEATRIRARIKKELKNALPKKQNKKDKGKYGPDRHEVLGELYKLTRLSREAAGDELVKRLSSYDKNNIPTEIDAIENNLLSVLSAKIYDVTDQDIELWKSTLDFIKNYKREGAANVKAAKQTEAERLESIREKMVELFGGLNEESKATGAKVRQSDLPFFKRLRNFFFAGGFQLGAIQDWSNILDILSYNDKDSLPGQSLLSKFGDVLDAENTEKAGGMKVMEQIQNIMKEAYNLKTDRQLYKKLQQDLIRHDLGRFEGNGTNHFVTLKMSRSEARKRYMELMDPTIQEVFFTSIDDGGKMGWTPEMVTAIRSFLTDEDMTFIQKQMEFYQEYYDSINEIYRLMYGVNLPHNEFYSPISRKGVAKEEDATHGEFLQDAPFRGTAAHAGGLKSRVRNMNTIELQGDMSAMTTHVMEMEHFKAWSLKLREFNSVFGNPEVRDAIIENFGSSALKDINQHIQDFARGRIDQKNNYKLLDGWRNNFTRAALAVKPTLFLKQLTSMVAFADSMPVGRWSTGFMAGLANPKKTWDELYNNSVYLQERWKNASFDRDVKSVMQSDEYKRMASLPSLLNKTMFLIKAGDMTAIIYGGYPIYKYYRSKGYSKEQAIKMFESIAQDTQQSSDLSKLSNFQKGNSIMKFFTMFKTTPLQYLRKEIAAIRNLKAGRISKTQFAKTMLIYHFVLPMLYQFISDLFFLDDDETDDLPISKGMLRAMVFGNFNGIFIFGDGMHFIYNKIMGLYDDSPVDIPVTQTFNDIQRAINKIDMDGMTDDDLFEALRAMGSTVGGVTGLPVKQTIDFTKGFSDTLSGEYEKGIAELMGWSPSVAEKRFKE